jgi:hypothetical protein
VEEDVADNGGLRKAYRAFKRASSRVGGLNATLPDLTSFTPEQLFFLGYATVGIIAHLLLCISLFGSPSLSYRLLLKQTGQIRKR